MRNPGEGLVEWECQTDNKGGILEEKPRKRHPRRGILEKEPQRGNPEKEIPEEESLKRSPGGGILKEAY